MPTFFFFFFVTYSVALNANNAASGQSIGCSSLDHTSFIAAFSPGFLSIEDYSFLDGMCFSYANGLPAPTGDPIFQADIYVYVDTGIS